MRHSDAGVGHQGNAGAGFDFGQYGVEVFRLAEANIERRLCEVRDDVMALAGFQKGEIDGCAVAGMRENPLQGRELVHEFDRGVPAVLRCHARVGGAPLDLDTNAGRAFAPDGERIRRVAGLHVELDLVPLDQGRYQLSGTGRTPLFAVIEEQRDGRVVLEAEIVQNLQRSDRVDHTAFLVADARTKATFPIDAERPSRHGSGAKHGVDVRDDEN